MKKERKAGRRRRKESEANGEREERARGKKRELTPGLEVLEPSRDREVKKKKK